MKRLLQSLLLSSFLFVSCAASNVMSPIQPLQFNGETFCTAFSINDKEGYWATARHCAEPIVAVPMLSEMLGIPAPVPSLAGNHVEVVYIDNYADIAVVKSSLKVKPLRLDAGSPAVGDDIAIFGFPYGLPNLVRSVGKIASLGMPIKGAPNSDLLDITIAGGNSGSPVVHLKDNKVIGVLWGKFNDADFALSSTQADTYRALKPYAK